MTISDELRDYLVAEFRKQEEGATRAAGYLQFRTKYVYFPIWIDGVLDQLRYVVSEKRFDKLIVTVAVDPSGRAGMTRSGAYCTQSETVEIDL